MGLLPASLAACLLLFFGQEEKPSAADVAGKHEEALKKIEGVIHVSAGGKADDMRILIRVKDEVAKAAVRKAIGDTLDGYKVFVYVSSQVGNTAVSPKPVDPPQPEPPPRPESRPERDSVENCDIMRDHLKLKPVTHHKDGKTFPPCQLIRRQRVGGAGGHNFWYTRHRADCPIRAGRIGMPERSDAFTKWVFNQGFQPAERASFLGPYELRGSDRLWFDQVKDDLTSLLPYIREGAQWVKAEEEKAGVGWKWEAPKPPERKP